MWIITFEHVSEPAGLLVHTPHLVRSRNEIADFVPTLYPSYTVIQSKETNCLYPTVVASDLSVSLPTIVIRLQHMAFENFRVFNVDRTSELFFREISGDKVPTPARYVLIYAGDRSLPVFRLTTGFFEILAHEPFVRREQRLRCKEKVWRHLIASGVALALAIESVKN